MKQIYKLLLIPASDLINMTIIIFNYLADKYVNHVTYFQNYVTYKILGICIFVSL